MTNDLTVVKLGGSHALSPLLGRWLGAIGRAAGQVVVVPGGGPFADAVRDAQPAMGFDDDAAHDMALMAMAQYGRALTALADGFVYADTLDAVRGCDGARRHSGVVALADAARASGYSAFLGRDLGQSGGLVRRCVGCAARGVDQASRPAPARGLVDAAFPHFAARFAGVVRIAGPDDLAAADALFGAAGLTMVRQRTPRWAWAHHRIGSFLHRDAGHGARAG